MKKQLYLVILALGVIVAMAFTSTPTAKEETEPTAAVTQVENTAWIQRIKIGTEITFKDFSGEHTVTRVVTEELKQEMMAGAMSVKITNAAGCDDSPGWDCGQACIGGIHWCCCQYWDEYYGEYMTECHPQAFC